MSTHARPRRLTPEDDARILRTYRHMVREGELHGAIKALVTRNGFTVIGHSAPASPENYREELGRRYAKENAVRQLWPLMGYALREKLSQGGAP